MEAGRYRGAATTHSGVWLFDLDTGAREGLVVPGVLLRDPLSGGTPIWSSVHPLRAVALNPLGGDPTPELVSVHASESGLAITREAPGRRLESLVDSRAAPWAEILRSPRSDPSDWVSVRWGVHEVRFEGEEHFVRALPSILPTPQPGKILVRRGDSLRIHDMRDSSEVVVLDSGASKLLVPSPDRSAVLVPGPGWTRVLDAASGDLLRAPWRSSESVVHWCQTSGAERVVQVGARRSSSASTRVIDLDTGVEFEIERDSTQSLLLRVGPLGYVLVRTGGDLVWVDLEGRLVKVLVER